jgi:hypothetical protein
MSVADWATTISGGIAVLTVVGMGVNFLIKHYLKEMRDQFRNNGGSTLKDKVDVNSSRLERLEKRVDEIYNFLLQRGE